MDIITLTKIVQEIYNATLQHEAKFKFLEKKNVIPSNFDEEFLKYINSEAIDVPSENPSNQENDKPSGGTEGNPSENNHTNSNHFITFESEDGSDFTLKFKVETKTWDGTLYKSVDCENWSEWDGKSISSQNGKLYLRGENNTVISYNKTTNYYNSFVINTAKYIHCLGNIETLLDYKIVEKNEHPTMGYGCFQQLFLDCRCLYTPPELPAVELSQRCYAAMFSSCNNLRTAPILPAMVAPLGCYTAMFAKCQNLKECPELPATQLDEGCYSGMFQDCTSLIKTPNELPALSVPIRAYQYMFSGCTSLKDCFDKLPATTVHYNCAYNGMFSDCKITKSIHLPLSLKNTLSDYNKTMGCSGITLLYDLV